MHLFIIIHSCIHGFMYVMYIQQTVDSSIMFGNSAEVTICASVDKALGARRAAAAGHAGDEEGRRAQSPHLGGELFEEKGAAPVMVGEVFQCFSAMAVRVKCTFFWEVEGTRWPLTFGPLGMIFKLCTECL